MSIISQTNEDDQKMEMNAIARARLSLEGLSIGDALGGICEYDTDEVFDQIIGTRIPPDRLWRFTDDTNMALSIYEILRVHGHIDQDKLASSFVVHFDRFRHYGRSVYNWFDRCIDGEPWRKVAETLFPNGSGSFGNGSVMRVAPIGAYFADDLPTLIDQAARSAEVTHSHPESLAGAIAIAVAASVAWQNRHSHMTLSDFLRQILPHIPASQVQRGVQKALNLPTSINTAFLASLVLGNGRQISAQDTVPFALWIAGTYLYDYEEAIWQAISHNGDVDTLAAVVGGIVALSAGEAAIPQVWRQTREPLPIWAIG